MSQARLGHWDWIALMFLALLALAGNSSNGHPSVSTAIEGASVVTSDPTALREMLLPTRPQLDSGSWVERNSHTSRNHVDAAVVAALTAIFALGFAALSLRAPGTPSPFRIGSCAPVRGPPLLLAT